MALTWRAGFDVDLATEGWVKQGTGTAASISTSVVRSGTGSLGIRGLELGLRSAYIKDIGTGTWAYEQVVRFYLKVVTLPNIPCNIGGWASASPYYRRAAVQLMPTGRLRLSPSLLAPHSPPLTLGKWHRVEILLDYNGVVNDADDLVVLRLDGVEWVRRTAALVSACRYVMLGGNCDAEDAARGEWYFDDVEVRMSSSGAREWPGPDSLHPEPAASRVVDAKRVSIPAPTVPARQSATIITSRTHKERPSVYEAEVDWNHPLSHGLVYVNLGGRKNLVSGRSSQYYEGQYRQGSMGGMLFDNDATPPNLWINSTDVLYCVGPASMYVTIMPYSITTGGAGPGVSLTAGSGDDIQVGGAWASAVRMWAAGPSYSGNIISDGSYGEWVEGKRNTAILGFGNTLGDPVRGFVNGVQVRNDTTIKSFANLGLTRMVLTGGNRWEMLSVGLWGTRFLTADEMRWLCAEPYCFLKPRVQRTFVLLGSSGPSANVLVDTLLFDPNTGEGSGVVLDYDGQVVTERGFVWATHSTPTVGDNKVVATDW